MQLRKRDKMQLERIQQVLISMLAILQICGFISIASEAKQPQQEKQDLGFHKFNQWNIDKWQVGNGNEWKWEEIGYLDCEVRFASKTSKCNERGKTQATIIEAKDIPTAYKLYMKKYGKMHQKSGYILEQTLPMENQKLVLKYEIPTEVQYQYAYVWSDDKSTLSIDLIFGMCGEDYNRCAKARLTFIDIGNDEESAFDNSKETPQNLTQESTTDSTTSQETKNTSLTQSDLDAKIILHAKNAKKAQKAKNAQNHRHAIKIIASVW